MLIPVRCVTCGKVLADKWMYYEKECKKLDSEGKKIMTLEDLSVIFKKNKESGNLEPNLKKDILDKLGLTRICCRRHMLGHVDMIEDI
jgi:DNA-directed RNA polymerase subunit N (RpoN/RPB10)